MVNCLIKMACSGELGDSSEIKVANVAKCTLHVLYQELFRKKKKKKICNRPRLRDVMGQSYPI